jgi:hypothetical protein
MMVGVGEEPVHVGDEHTGSAGYGNFPAGGPQSGFVPSHR